MPIYECKRCSPVNIPDDWTIEYKSEIAKIIRETSPLRAIEKFKPIEMNLGDAKNISFHVTRKPRHCHGCEKELIEYEGNCPKCRKLNLDW